MATKAIDTERAERAELIEELRNRLPIGTTIYTVLRSVSASGAYRRMSAFYILPNSDRLVRLDDAILRLGIGQRTRNGAEGFGVSGGGMDMGFHVVYSFGRALWPDGYMIDDEDDPRAGSERDGGYAYTQRWL